VCVLNCVICVYIGVVAIPLRSFSTMELINGTPFSSDMWEWYHHHKWPHVLDFDQKLDNSCSKAIFAYWFAVEGRGGYPMDYSLMTAGQFWEFAQEALLMASGVSMHPVPATQSLLVLGAELDKIKRTLLWWAFAEGVPPERIGDMDGTMVGKERLNQLYRYRAHYYYLIIEKAYDKLLVQMAKYQFHEVALMKPFMPEMRAPPGDNGTFLYELIRKSCAGDQDEFILYAADDIQKNSMTVDHEKLAQLVRFEKFEEFKFDEPLPASEMWRMIFPKVMEGFDEVFLDFYCKFTSQCVLFFLHDFLFQDFEIEKIPFYNLFTRDLGASCTADVVGLLDQAKITAEIARLNKIYMAS